LLISRLSQPDLQLFQDAWNETRPVLQQQVSLLNSITSEGNPIWSAIQRVELTGKNLKMKIHHMVKAASEGWRKKLLDLLNKFLGSLAGGLPLFRRVNKVGKAWGDGMTEKSVWHIVKESANAIGLAKLAPHNLRRTCARLCHASGGELERSSSF
jgi:integrase